MEEEIDRLIEIIVNSTREDYPGDTKYDNKCWAELGKLGCIFAYASNRDYESTKDGILQVLKHLQNIKKEK